jgi:predicted RNase H-like HicB family nuclease
MKFIVAIEPGTETTAFGVVVPDLPGCFSAGATLDEAVDNAREAIDLWCETVIEDGGDVPVAKTLSAHQADADFAGWIWAVVEVPVERYYGPAEKLNITLPRLLLAKIDEYARAHGETRSGFLAEAARNAMR